MSKRLFDLLASTLGLLLLSPLLVAIGVWIRCDSAGPALYRQQRVGRGGTLFWIYKFRTMRAECAKSAASAQLTVGRDYRITRAGHFLRAYKIDELPQLFNVIQGSMSLVGPRPEVPRYVACYPEAVRREVLSVAPGITDWASIEYRQENAILGASIDPEQVYIDQVLPAKLVFYQRYVRERTFWLDLRIIGGTLSALVRSR
ncbi:sugar transferase [Massilia sp. DWR3-1-1]|uniref:sugar transferase n=1 Tax=Massilia sp. DWR3-1-1 TaxID=2804559 RepID=UPI003CF1FA6B